jgi:hypothetical protein
LSFNLCSQFRIFSNIKHLVYLKKKRQRRVLNLGCFFIRRHRVLYEVTFMCRSKYEIHITSDKRDLKLTRKTTLLNLSTWSLVKAYWL